MNRLLLWFVFAVFFLGNPLAAQEVTVHYGAITLNANLQFAPGKSMADGLILLTHGTLAHNAMELITTLQAGFAGQGRNTLAINLSLGVDNRHGPYDCTIPHTHHHQEAVDEIGVWLSWLREQGATSVVLMGHSRGGNQTAWFAAEQPDPLVKAVVLLAPMTWDAASQATAYQARFGRSLADLIHQAQEVQSTDRLSNIDFLYCTATTAQAGSVLSYYQADPRFDTPYLLPHLSVPTLVIAGAADTTIPDIPAKVAALPQHTVKSVVIAGADHFFRDLYSDDVVETVEAFLTQVNAPAKIGDSALR